MGSPPSARRAPASAARRAALCSGGSLGWRSGCALTGTAGARAAAGRGGGASPPDDASDGAADDGAAALEEGAGPPPRDADGLAQVPRPPAPSSSASEGVEEVIRGEGGWGA